MPSKLKIKKSQKKSKRPVSTACWERNDDGTLSLTIGSKKANLVDETSSVSDDSVQSAESPTATNDCNGNAIIHMKENSPPEMVQPALPIKIMKSNWSQNGVDYRIRQQTKRRDEMTAQ